MTLWQRLTSREVWTLPNSLSIARIIASPLLIVGILLWAPHWGLVAAGVLTMASDKLDGVLARRRGTTAVGAFLDSTSDKIVVLGTLLALLLRGMVWWFPVLLIATREVLMSLWRTRLARRGVSVPARELGKWKAFLQGLAITSAVVPGVLDHHAWVFLMLLWSSVALTYASLVQYVWDGSHSRSHQERFD